MQLTKLNELYENWMTGDGVFTDLNDFDVPWKTENNVNALNMAYHGSHSGDKNVSPVVYKFLKSEDENTRAKLASIIFTMFGDKWSKLWGALAIEYNPLENYNMTEYEETDGTIDNETTHTGTVTTTRTGTDTTTHTGTDANAKTGTDTLTMTGTDTNRKLGDEDTTHTGTDTTTKTGNETVSNAGTVQTDRDGTNENEVSAFNSASYQDNAKDTIDTTDLETRDLEGETVYDTETQITKNLTDATDIDITETETRNMTDQTTYANTETETRNMTDQTAYASTETETRNLTDMETRNMTDTDTHNTSEVLDGEHHNERELTRSGNIGVTTSQQMLQSEIELRKWVYYQSVFNDIDTILTLSIY